MITAILVAGVVLMLAAAALVVVIAVASLPVIRNWRTGRGRPDYIPAHARHVSSGRHEPARRGRRSTLRA